MPDRTNEWRRSCDWRHGAATRNLYTVNQKSHRSVHFFLHQVLQPASAAPVLYVLILWNISCYYTHKYD